MKRSLHSRQYGIIYTMKGNIMRAVLREIGELTIDMVDLFDVYLEAGYGASYGKIQYLLGQKEKGRIMRKRKREEWARYRKFMSYLERDGLLKKDNTDGIKFTLTKKGREKIKKESLRINLPNEKLYQKKKNATYIIVIFDIPELEKRKRYWLREALKHLGFTMIQKSVWIGNIKVPQELISDIFELGLGKYVDIFEATKVGTLLGRE